MKRGLVYIGIIFIFLLIATPEILSQCYQNNINRVALFSPFLNNNPRGKKKIPTENFGDSSARATRKCAGKGIIHTGNGYYLEIGEPIFAPISGIVHIYTLGSSDLPNNTRTGVWVEAKNLTINLQGLQPVVEDGQYIYKGQQIGKGFDNYGEAGVYFTVRNAPPQNPTAKRSFLPLAENPQTPCKCNNEPVFPEYFINSEQREIDYNEYNELLPQGELSVHIEPSGVGVWSFDNGETWQSSGTKISGLPYHYYKIIFKNEFGYRSPTSLSYNLSSSKKSTVLSAIYTPDYSILPRPAAHIEREQMQKDLEAQILLTKDSIKESIRLSLGLMLKDSLQILQEKSGQLIFDSLNKRYSRIAEIQEKQLSISKMFKLFLPIIACLALGLGIFFFQYLKIRKQKKLLELMQTEQHHRVYNNLGIITGLVEEYGKEIGKEKIADIRNSILAISKVHSQLYKGDTPEFINLNALFVEIGKALVSQPSINSHKKELDINCHVNISQVKATKLALIINELITNSLKHGNDNLRHALIIKIHGYKSENTNEIIIHYRDNGNGFNELPYKGADINGTGMVLMFGLANEIKADIKFFTDEGACCLIKLKP